MFVKSVSKCEAIKGAISRTKGTAHRADFESFIKEIERWINDDAVERNDGGLIDKKSQQYRNLSSVERSQVDKDIASGKRLSPKAFHSLTKAQKDRLFANRAKKQQGGADKQKKEKEKLDRMDGVQRSDMSKRLSALETQNRQLMEMIKAKEASSDGDQTGVTFQEPPANAAGANWSQMQPGGR